MQPIATIDMVITFWKAAGDQLWFGKDELFDARCRDGFLTTHEAAARGDLAGWEASADGALALVLLLDQFPRNMFRGTPRAFATDAAALEVAGRAIERGFEDRVDPELRPFFYLPFMHAEDFAVQERSVALYAEAGLDDNLAYAIEHRDIIARFGRFPHRNPILGRASSEAERKFLDEGGFAG
jgi:uncharacterized protein (DUF924 family)